VANKDGVISYDDSWGNSLNLECGPDASGSPL
jgi:hypothetical protein